MFYTCTHTHNAEKFTESAGFSKLNDHSVFATHNLCSCLYFVKIDSCPKAFISKNCIIFPNFKLLEILAANSRLTRDRQLLAKEVEFLRFQLSRINTEEIIRLNSSSKPLVDDILNAITKEERENLPATTFKITDLLMTAADFEDIAEEKEKVN